MSLTSLTSGMLIAGRLTVLYLIIMMFKLQGITGINHGWSVRTRHIGSEGQVYIFLLFLHAMYLRLTLFALYRALPS